MINWKIRLMNKNFWVTIIPALALLAQAVASLFGFTLELETLVGKIIAVVDTAFGVLVILGVVQDPTTAGIGDSKRAMSYEEPWQDEIQPPDEAG